MSIENSFNKTFKGGKSLDRKITRNIERNNVEKGGASKSSKSSSASTPRKTQEQRINNLMAQKKHPKVQGWLQNKSTEINNKKNPRIQQSSSQNTQNFFSNSSNVFNKQKSNGRSI